MAEYDVKMLGTWASPFAMRVRDALNNKSVDYDFLEDKLLAESELLLLKSNPVHKKVPVLIHGDNPIRESLVIVEHIDEVWHSNPSILPADPYERAIARFWAAYVDEKPRRPESVVVGEGVKCFPCILVEDLLGEIMKGMKNKFRKSDFQSFPQGWKACDGNNVPPYLNYVHEGLGRNIAATATLRSKDIIAHTRAYVYAAIDEMHRMKLEDITDENVILKWGCVIRDAKKMDFDVEFAEEHLKKIAHAYFLSKGPAAAESNKEEHVICSMSERECIDDDAPLTKGLLLFASSEHSA